jgi:hypothetical protein
MGIPPHDTEGRALPCPASWTRLSSGIIRREVAVSKPEPEICPFEAPKISERGPEPPAEVKAVKVGRGRPKKEGKRPWEEAGMSKSTWYEKKSKGEV